MRRVKVASWIPLAFILKNSIPHRYSHISSQQIHCTRNVIIENYNNEGWPWSLLEISLVHIFYRLATHFEHSTGWFMKLKYQAFCQTFLKSIINGKYRAFKKYPRTATPVSNLNKINIMQGLDNFVKHTKQFISCLLKSYDLYKSAPKS